MGIISSAMMPPCWPTSGPQSIGAVSWGEALQQEHSRLSERRLRSMRLHWSRAQRARTSRTNRIAQDATSDAEGDEDGPPSGTPPTPGDRTLPCRRQPRGELPRPALRKELAL